VTNWGVPCGIATYAKSLRDAIDDRSEVRIFAAREPNAITEPNVIRCWTGGEPLSELVKALHAYQPDVILISHEYGHHPIARHWIAFMSALNDRHTFVVLHSVYEHPDKVVVEASCPRIIVHTEDARQVLQAKGIQSEITVIPHGCRPPCKPAIWNLYGSKHTILQGGFGFPYKNWKASIQVTRELISTYPDVFLTLLVAERWPGVHREYVSELQRYAESIGAEEHIGIIRGFQPDKLLDAFWGQAQVGLFPYTSDIEHAVHGASGAIREAMSRGVAVVASGVPHFSDMPEIVPRPNDLQGWTNAVAAIFEHPEGRVEAQNAYLLANSWENIADQYLETMSKA
jgi:glycosyltransferase involved in cell wall biosynthesis